MDKARDGHAPVRPTIAITKALRQNASCLRKAIGSEKLQSLIPVLFGNGIFRYEEYEQLEKSRGHLMKIQVVEKVAVAMEMWLENHHSELNHVVDSLKFFKCFQNAILWIKNDYEMYIQGGAQDESSLEFSHDPERFSRASSLRTLKAEGKSTPVSNKPIAEQFSGLHSKYDDTFLQVKAIICKHVPLKRLKEQIGCQWLGLDCEGITSSDQLMVLFWKQSCAFPHMHELVMLVDALGIGNAQRIVCNYEEMRKKLNRQISVEEFAKRSLQQQHQDWNVKVEFVVAWSREKITLQDFEDFVRKVFGFLHTHLNLQEISNCPLSFVCSAPFFSANAIVRMIQEKQRLLLQSNVLSIAVGYNIVFKADDNVTPQTHLVKAESDVRDLDSLHRELKESLRDEVRRELHDEMRDEIEEVYYDEVPLEGVANVSCKLKKLQDDVLLLLDELKTGLESEVGSPCMKLLKSNLKQVSALVASSSRIVESPQQQNGYDDSMGCGEENVEVNGNASFIFPQKNEKHTRCMNRISASKSTDLQTLVMDLDSVVQWFSLGVFLGVPAHELDRLKQTHGSKHGGLVEVLDLWLKQERVDFGDLLTALQFCGLSSLAQTLATKHGIQLPGDDSPMQSPTSFRKTGLSSVVFAIQDHELQTRMNRVEEQEREVLQLAHQAEQLEKRMKELAQTLQAATSSLDEATRKSQILTQQHRELCLQIEEKRLDRDLLCKQGTNEQSAIKLLTETELSIKVNSLKMSEIDKEIQKHESLRHELGSEFQTREMEFKKETSSLQNIKKQLLQSKIALEKRSRLFDIHMQKLLSKQSSTAVAENAHKIPPSKREHVRRHCSSMLPRSEQTSSKSTTRVVRTVPMDRHLTSLHQRVQQEGTLNSEANSPPVYFYEGINDLDAERLLTQEKLFVGTFLVWRDSESIRNETMMSVLGKDRIYHSVISQEIVDHHPTPESFVKFFKDGSNTLECYPVVPCPKANHLEDLEAPEMYTIELDQHLREGRFTNMWVGYFGEERMKVLVKSLKRGQSSVCQFQSEAVIMKDLQHSNILSMHAFIAGQQPYIITEPVIHASLHQYFTKSKCRETEISSLVNIAAQVASGMAYLESLKCIHRNVAARNVMLAGRGAKIANFSQACYTPSGKFKCDPGLILLRWTAPEVLSESTFSSKSDVWSFGVLLWEMFTHGDLPYSKMKDDNVREKIKSGYHLPKPKRCPQAVYAIMTKCWIRVPDDRPSFGALADKFSGEKHSSNSYYTIVY